MVVQILKTSVAKKRTKRIKRLLKLYGLSRRHVYLARRGTGWQPYHNYQHCYEVALNVSQGAVWAKLGRAETKQLILAALYHDHRHTADYRVPDATNIARAVRGVKWKLLLHPRGLKGFDRRTVPWMIENAQQGRQPRQPALRLLRDAELLANVNEETYLWLAALSKEEGREFTVETMLAYLSDEKILTDWGRARLTKFRQNHDYAPPLNLISEETADQSAQEWIYAPGGVKYRAPIF